MSALLVSTIKLHLTEPRPFFLTDATGQSIVPSSCKDLEYGYPSGHAFVTTCTFLTLFHFATINLKGKYGVYKMVAYVVLTLTLFIVAFSRAYNGVHSFD